MLGCKRRQSVPRKLDESGHRKSIVVLAHHFSADRLLLNFACSCQRLGHSVTVITAKGDPAKPRSVEEGPTVEVVPLDALFGSAFLARLVWLPATCVYLWLAGKKFDFAVHAESVSGVSTRVVASSAVLCVPTDPLETKGILRKIGHHLFRICPVPKCGRRLRRRAWPVWSAVVVEEGSAMLEELRDRKQMKPDPKVHVVHSPELDVRLSNVDVPLEQMGISLPVGQHFFVAPVTHEEEARFLLKALSLCLRPSLVLMSPKPLKLDVGDLPVIAVAGENSQLQQLRRVLTHHSAAYIHTPGANRASLADALLLKRPVIAYGCGDVDLLLGPHAVVVERQEQAVANAFLKVLHLAEEDHGMWANLGDAAKQRVYHLERVAAFDQSVSYALNPVAARVQASSTTDFWATTVREGDERRAAEGSDNAPSDSEGTDLALSGGGSSRGSTPMGSFVNVQEDVRRRVVAADVAAGSAAN